jgi:hypothetical protein
MTDGELYRASLSYRRLTASKRLNEAMLALLRLMVGFVLPTRAK